MKMTVNYEWLCDLVEDLHLQSPQTVGLALTAIGAETENISILHYGKNVELGKIINIEPLDTIFMVTIETGVKKYRAVSNSVNLQEGGYVLFAPVGVYIFGDKHVEPKEINGIQTEGLLLALENLGIESKSSDIAHLGTDHHNAEKAFQIYTSLDALYTLDVPGNRPDWLSVRGLAKALAIYFQLELKEHFSFQSTEPAPNIAISIESDNCNRYSIRKISNLSNTTSEVMFQKRLLLLGMRSINKIVDLTNIVMLETGQPTHAFDVRSINKNIIIRQAKSGEKLTLLDEKEITLTENDLVICSEKNILALAGIMGGINSGVQDDTTEIYLESASFHGITIRRSAKRLGIKTESSLRFEKNISPELVPYASNCIATLLCGTISEQTDVYPHPKSKIEISCTPDEIRKYLGAYNLDDSIMASVIQKIGCVLYQHERHWVIVPSGERTDLNIKEDIIEEIARFYGYDKIPTNSYRPSQIRLNPEKSFDEKIRPLLRGMGVSEAITIVFRSPSTRIFNKITTHLPVPITNPLNTEWTEMRTHLFDGLLGILKHNISKAFEKNIAFSEIASVFRKEGENFIEEKRLAFMISNDSSPYEQGLNILNNILTYAKIDDTTAQRIDSSSYEFLHPRNAFEIIHNDTVIGFFGETHPELTEKYDLSDKTDFPHPVICELLFDTLQSSADKRSVLQPLQELPPILRDITLAVPENTLGLNISNKIKQMHPALKDVEFVSIFQNEQLKEKGVKNLTFRLRFDHIKDTMEIDNLIKTLLTEQH